MSLTFVGGIHGSGKTTLCHELAACTGAQHLIAGTLIREGRTMPVTKQVADVDANQTALLAALAARVQPGSHVILDGHFTLFTPDGIRAIPADVFRAIAPAALIVVTADPVAVAARLAHRDGQQYAPDLLRDLQLRELGHATDVASILRVPLIHGANLVAADLVPVLRRP